MSTAINGTPRTAASAPPLAPIPIPVSLPPPTPPSSSSTPPAEPLDPRARTLCHILSTVPHAEIELSLSRCGIPALPSIVDSVLRHSFPNPAAAVRFFRWAALSAPHSSSSWNLMVQLLASNSLFEAAWDAIRSMRDEPSAPLSTSTFVSLIQSYCSFNRVKEALMTFEVMPRYGVEPNVFAVNSLLSAVCRLDRRASDAADFFDKIKLKIPPDADTYAILLEAWEKEANVARAKTTFGDMVVRLGWDPRNSPAHDAFLTTLVHGGEAADALQFLKVMKSKGCLPGMKFFASALDFLFRKDDLPNAIALWDTMVGGGIVPNTVMFNAMIALYCARCDFTAAWRLLDEMPLQGAFPDSITYNAIFECLVKNKRVREAGKFLGEMRKNEWPPSPSNCVAAVRMFFDQFDPEAALEVWKCVLEERVALKEECANEMLVGLRELGRMAEAKKYAEDMIHMGIKLLPSTMCKLKSGFQKAGKLDVYERLEKKWKAR